MPKIITGWHAGLMGISYVIFLEATNIDAFALQQNFFNTPKSFALCAQTLMQQALQETTYPHKRPYFNK
jgi:hypothetical protein